MGRAGSSMGFARPMQPDYDMVDAMPEMMMMMDDVGATVSVEPTVQQTVRTFFPETWLWDIQLTE